MKSTNYTLGDLFRVIHTAQTKIKIAKAEREWTVGERRIMEFSIDSMFPSDPTYKWRRKRATSGMMTQRQFRNLRDIFESLLPGVTKMNLQKIMQEVRKTEWEKISARRGSKKPWKPHSESLNYIADANYKDQVITLDRMYCPRISLDSMKIDGTFEEAQRGMDERSQMWGNFTMEIKMKYREIAEKVFNTTFMTDSHCYLDLYRYKNNDGRSGLMLELRGYIGNGYKTMTIPIWKLRDYDLRHGHSLKDETFVTSEESLLKYLRGGEEI